MTTSSIPTKEEYQLLLSDLNELSPDLTTKDEKDMTIWIGQTSVFNTGAHESLSEQDALVLLEAPLKAWGNLQKLKTKKAPDSAAIVETARAAFFGWLKNKTTCSPHQVKLILPEVVNGTVVTTKGVFSNCGLPPKGEGDGPVEKALFNKEVNRLLSLTKTTLQDILKIRIEPRETVSVPYEEVFRGKIYYQWPEGWGGDGPKYTVDFLAQTGEHQYSLNLQGSPVRIKKFALDSKLNENENQLLRQFLLLQELQIKDADKDQLDILHSFHASCVQYFKTKNSSQMVLFLIGSHKSGKTYTNTLLSRALDNWPNRAISKFGSYMARDIKDMNQFTQTKYLMKVADDRPKDKSPMDTLKFYQSSCGEIVADEMKTVDRVYVNRSFSLKVTNNNLPQFPFIDDRLVFLELTDLNSKPGIQEKIQKIVQFFEDLSTAEYGVLLDSIVKYYLNYEINPAIYNRKVYSEILKRFPQPAVDIYLRPLLHIDNQGEKLLSQDIFTYLGKLKVSTLNPHSTPIFHIKFHRGRRLTFMTSKKESLQHHVYPEKAINLFEYDLKKLLGVTLNTEGNPFLVEYYSYHRKGKEYDVLIKFSDKLDPEKFITSMYTNNSNDYLSVALEWGTKDPSTIKIIDMTNPRFISHQEEDALDEAVFKSRTTI